MSKYSEKKERQAKEAARQQVNPEAERESKDGAILAGIRGALRNAKDCLDAAMLVRTLLPKASGPVRFDLEAVKGRIVSARDKIASALARMPEGVEP